MSSTMQKVNKSQEEYDMDWLEHRRKMRELVSKRIPPKADTQMEQLAQEIFEYWNSKNIIIHRKCSRRIPIILNVLTQEYSKEEILQAIDNYSTVFHDEDYYFNYRWKLEVFLQKSNTFPDFVNDGSKWLSYLGTKSSRVKLVKEISKPKQREESVSEIIEFKSIADTYNKLINTLKIMPYNEYLQTEHWLHFKNEALKNVGFKCQLCASSKDVLHVHHNNYSNRGRETFNDVIVLCGKCHEKFHKEEK